MTESLGTNAFNFALDCQELAQNGDLNLETLASAINRYGGSKVDAVTIAFPDGSAAAWSADEHGWQLIEQ